MSGNRSTHAKQRQRLRRMLRDLGYSEEQIARRIEEKQQRQHAKRESSEVNNRGRQHANRRREFRKRLEAAGIPPTLIDAAVERLRALQATARRADVRVSDLEAIFNETHAAMRLDDSGYKPDTGDPLLRGVARATGATAKAVKRSKATTRYEHQREESA